LFLQNWRDILPNSKLKLTKLTMKTLFFCLLFGLNALAQTQEATHIYLVRHAEKITSDPTAKDPLLTEFGLKRAKALAKMFKKIKLDAIYSTDYQRTKLTATPVATKQNITIKMYSPKNLKDWAKGVLEENKGKNILVVGHSNTLLETIEALGGQRPFASIADQEYDYFFRVTIKENQQLEVEVLHYGKPNTNQEGQQKMDK
jgi:broad specificity phosphatase PhoE